MNWFQLLEHAATGGALLVHLALKATVLLLVCSAAVAVLRRSSAAVRHSVWSMCCLCLLLLPLFTAALPAWHPAIWQPEITKSPLLPLAPTTADSVATFIYPTQSPSVLPLTPPVPSTSPTISTSQWLLAALFACWLLGVAVVARKLLIGFMVANRLSRRGQLVTQGALWDEFTNCAESLQLDVSALKRNPRLLLVADKDLPIPLTWGFWPPMVLLPESSKQWTPSSRRAALLHELSHIRRLDWLIQSLASLTCLLYWFHPLTWFASHRLRLESERATDDHVLTTGIKATDYSSSLLEIVRLVGAHRQNALHPKDSLMKFAVPMSGTSKIEIRLRSILDPKQSRSAVTKKLLAGITVAALTTVVPLAAAKAGSPNEPQKPTEVDTPTEPASAADSIKTPKTVAHKAVVSPRKNNASPTAPKPSAAQTTSKTTTPTTQVNTPTQPVSSASTSEVRQPALLSPTRGQLSATELPSTTTSQQTSPLMREGYVSYTNNGKPTEPTAPTQSSASNAQARTEDETPTQPASPTISVASEIQRQSNAPTENVYVREAYVHADVTNQIRGNAVMKTAGTIHPKADTIVTGFKFSGNTLVEDDELKKVLVSKTGILFKTKNVVEDETALKRVYAAKGSILWVKYVSIDDAGVMTYHLIENPAVTGYRFNGNKALSADELAKVMVSKMGVRYDWKSVEEDKKAIKKAYAAQGLEVSINNVMQDSDGSISYDVAEGKITQVNIVGLTKTDPEVARKLIMAKVDDPADPLTFYLDTIRINQSKLFKSYGIKHKDDPDVKGGVIVTYTFVEKEDTI